MQSADVVELYTQLNHLGIEIWLDGGWGVDALLGEQTRSHSDLDIVIQHKDVPQLRELLEARGYKDVPRDDTSLWNFVLGDDKGRLVDVHAVTLDAEGNGLYGPSKAGVMYPAGSLTGSGVVDGHAVRCISAEYVVKFHTGYKLRESDYADVTAICARFDIEYPEEYAAMKRKKDSASHYPGLPVRLSNAAVLAAAMDREIKTLSAPNTSALRAIRAKYSRALQAASPDFVMRLARSLLRTADYRWIAYELIREHRPAFESLRQTDLEELGRGINSWWTVDAFARTLSGPAWLQGQVPDRLILKWASSPDPWWRRAALVSTVALNVRSQGGMGDAPRTLQVCHMLVKDREEMVVKAMSWALRELVVHDPQGVREFLDENDAVLAARVKREVRNKLKMGRKSRGGVLRFCV